jgi:ORF6N domain
MPGARASPVGAERVAHFILAIRRQRVLLDADLAALYRVETRVLLQAVRRNSERFPPDFMFELSAAEWTQAPCRALIEQATMLTLVHNGNCSVQSEEPAMSKAMDTRKDAKKKPAKSLMEKRAAKREKKASRGFRV